MTAINVTGPTWNTPAQHGRCPHLQGFCPQPHVRHLACILLASSIIITSCTRLSPLATPTGSALQPSATTIAEAAKTAMDPTPTTTPTLSPTTQTAAPPSKTPLGLTQSNPATIHTAVQHPQMTITLIGMELPAGFPSVTPDPGHRFVAPQLAFFCQLPATSHCQRIGSFELIDAQGTRHSPSIAVSGEGFLSTEAFPGGTSITGGMVFMVPIEATPMILRYVGSQGREAFFQID